MPRDWKAFWSDAGKRSSDLRNQVGRTLGGEPTSEEELEVLINSVREVLGEGSRHLDLCCGNGYLTARLELASEVTGVDYSVSLLEVARDCFTSIEFIHGSIAEIDEVLKDQLLFDRVTMLESLQYFDQESMAEWFPLLLDRCSKDCKILFQGVPDEALFHRFADTPERKEKLRQLRETQGDPIGHWWNKSLLEEVVDRNGCTIKFFKLDDRLNTAHYRFDALVERKQ